MARPGLVYLKRQARSRARNHESDVRRNRAYVEGLSATASRFERSCGSRYGRPIRSARAWWAISLAKPEFLAGCDQKRVRREVHID